MVATIRGDFAKGHCFFQFSGAKTKIRIESQVKEPRRLKRLSGIEIFQRNCDFDFALNLIICAGVPAKTVVPFEFTCDAKKRFDF